MSLSSMFWGTVATEAAWPDKDPSRDVLVFAGTSFSPTPSSEMAPSFTDNMACSTSSRIPSVTASRLLTSLSMLSLLSGDAAGAGGASPEEKRDVAADIFNMLAVSLIIDSTVSTKSGLSSAGDLLGGVATASGDGERESAFAVWNMSGSSSTGALVGGVVIVSAARGRTDASAASDAFTTARSSVGDTSSSGEPGVASSTFISCCSSATGSRISGEAATCMLTVSTTPSSSSPFSSPASSSYIPSRSSSSSHPPASPSSCPSASSSDELNRWRSVTSSSARRSWARSTPWLSAPCPASAAIRNVSASTSSSATLC
mmetsp:Transcript_28420/g.62479  ORF Transcript_28420/g.62479 Transcript_28420/m.62479 type:complete len:316 (+) Transcript_28420:1703-2650(+)